MGQSDKVMKEEGGQIPGTTKDSLQKKGGLGATPAFAAAPNRPFFQDNLLNNQSLEFSRKIIS